MILTVVKRLYWLACSQVRHKGTGAEYALKMVDKHLIVRHRMVGHIKQERNILDECDYPGIARLYFTFQVLQGSSSVTLLGCIPMHVATPAVEHPMSGTCFCVAA